MEFEIFFFRRASVKGVAIFYCVKKAPAVFMLQGVATLECAF
jgi:hypothetical protein